MTCVEQTHLQPTDIEKESQEPEYRNVDINVIARISLAGVQILPRKQGSKKIRIDDNCGHLDLFYLIRNRKEVEKIKNNNNR